MRGSARDSAAGFRCSAPLWIGLRETRFIRVTPSTPLGAACAGARGAGDGDARFGTRVARRDTRRGAKFEDGRVGVGRRARFRGLSIADRKRHRRCLSFAGGAEEKVFASRRVARSEGEATRGLGVWTDLYHREVPQSAEMMPCMLCNNANAAIYCYNDNAYLCKACDGQIHNKNKLAWRHQRSYLCEVCDSVPPKPAVVYCAQDKVSARARISPPEPSRWRCAAAFPRFHDDGKTEDHPRPSTFRASVVGVVGRRLRRGATVESRARRALSRNAPPASRVPRRAR